MKIPETMRAVAIDRYGGPSVLSMHELPVPPTGANEVLIAVHTAGVGGWDASMREGPTESEHTRFPKILGTDGSGTIVAGYDLTRSGRRDRHQPNSAAGNRRRGGRVAYPNGIAPAPRPRRGITFKAYDAEPGTRELEHLDRAWRETRLQIPIAKTYTLANAIRAHQRLAKGHILGKIVLRVAEK